MRHQIRTFFPYSAYRLFEGSGLSVLKMTDRNNFYGFNLQSALSDRVTITSLKHANLSLIFPIH